MTQTLRILIVEDDPALIRGLSDNFRAAGFDVTTATDGQLGLTHALTQPPDLMLLDIMLPKINGYDLCRRVRHAKHDFPIVMLTAKGQEEEIVRGLELGADDYVTKPFGIRELLARVKRLLRREMSDSKELVVLGEMVLDRDARKLTHDGEEIPLTQKEYRLLDYFVTNPHRALTRSSILDAVWGRSIIVSHRSVDRCITTLRSKLEAQPSQPKFIHTIRDIGYRFELPAG
ncbi:DNA-binding response OmpR family regulator [Rhodopirellula rubra]|uniref:Phosphate regulon transcriptional regulatory protein PhoB n=1 Tax=Aporhodopirellula rubra TaxID=980271 RepID=A0A7W5H5V9_9BACT|nr:response regulator transcription factor [Aporhodopirellula rubra]MBB3206829.1 DNA-binding response OmpR family regulator [Aporhodopirellula rubra]